MFSSKAGVKIGGLLFAIAAVITVITVPSVTFGQDECDELCQQDLAAARRATAKYHREEVALADGYIGAAECVESPAGGMGTHYFNLELSSNLAVDVSQPETLLYARSSSGRMRLVGVEYFVPVVVGGAPWFGDANTPPPTGTYNPAPVLFGRSFDGPMPGHEPGMPWHYDLHVWVWKNNPSGMFSPFNPTVSCSQQ